jgi:hypothetical protein
METYFWPHAYAAQDLRLILTVLFVLLLRLPASAPNVTLAWDPSPDPWVNAYRLYIGDAPRHYTNSILTTNTVVTVSNLLASQTYYFAATCTNLFRESEYSSEVAWFSAGNGLPVQLTCTMTNTPLPTIKGVGQPFRAYTIERSTNLSCWIGFITVTADSSGRFSVTDPELSNTSAYYRSAAY